MKCLLLNQTFYPDRAATAQVTYDLARFLIQEGWEVTVLTARRAYGRPGVIYSRREAVEGIQIERVPCTGFGKSRFWRRILDALSFDFFLALKLLRVPKHDVVIGFTSPPLIGVMGTFFCWL